MEKNWPKNSFFLSCSTRAIYIATGASKGPDGATGRKLTRGSAVFPWKRRKCHIFAAIRRHARSAECASFYCTLVLVQHVGFLISSLRFDRFGFQSQWLYLGSKNYQIKGFFWASSSFHIMGLETYKKAIINRILFRIIVKMWYEYA